MSGYERVCNSTPTVAHSRAYDREENKNALGRDTQQGNFADERHNLGYPSLPLSPSAHLCTSLPQRTINSRGSAQKHCTSTTTTHGPGLTSCRTTEGKRVCHTESAHPRSAAITPAQPAAAASALAHRDRCMGGYTGSRTRQTPPTGRRTRRGAAWRGAAIVERRRWRQSTSLSALYMKQGCNSRHTQSAWRQPPT